MCNIQHVQHLSESFNMLVPKPWNPVKPLTCQERIWLRPKQMRIELPQSVSTCLNNLTRTSNWDTVIVRYLSSIYCFIMLYCSIQVNSRDFLNFLGFRAVAIELELGDVASLLKWHTLASLHWIRLENSSGKTANVSHSCFPFRSQYWIVLDSVGCSLFPRHFSLFQAAGPFGVTAASWLRYDRIAAGHCVERKNILSLSYIHCLWVHLRMPFQHIQIIHIYI